MITLLRILQWITLISGENWDAGHDLVFVPASSLMAQ